MFSGGLSASLSSAHHKTLKLGGSNQLLVCPMTQQRGSILGVLSRVGRKHTVLLALSVSPPPLGPRLDPWADSPPLHVLSLGRLARASSWE